MTRGSKFARPFHSRAEHSVALLRIINLLRLELPRDSPLLRGQEEKLFERDQIHGYDRTWWAAHGKDRKPKPLEPGESIRNASQSECRSG